jgi:predicted ATPase/serine phosphatase RsbU (regulator of sigma subunit)
MDSLVNYSLDSRIRQTATTAVYRARRAADGAKVLIKTLRAEYPGQVDLARIEHEHALFAELTLDTVVRPIGVERAGNGVALVLRDPGESSVSELLARGPLSTLRRVELALSMARALAALHEQGILHKDIRPLHFFVADASPTSVVLADLSHATRLVREVHVAGQPNGDADALRYVAPEQTGRTNRSVDRRSDLYSLGASLFELFTGQPPFTVSDPAELIHCQLARRPPRADEIERGLPAALADVVDKLLAKAPDERYQTAAGLVHDLAHCLDCLERTGEVASFALARRDASGELCLPEKLYGRERDLARLDAALARAIDGGTELVIVSGCAGSGKSALVAGFAQRTPESVQFARGAFEQDDNVPYGALVAACRNLVDQIAAQPIEALTRTRQALLDALGPNARVLIDLVPALGDLLGAQAPVRELGPREARHRLENVFRAFIRVFSADGRPLVLFLDDLQWADSGSLALLESVLLDPAARQLLVLGGCRTGEAAREALVRTLLGQLRTSGMPSGEVELGPLGEGEVEELLHDALGGERSTHAAFAALLHQKARGNPLHVASLLGSLKQDAVLTFDRQAQAWSCDLARLSAVRLAEDAIEPMLARLAHLPPSTQHALRVAACVGAEFDSETVEHVSDSAAELQAALWPALLEGLIEPLDASYRLADPHALRGATRQERASVRYRFAHERVRHAAASTLSEHEKARIHLGIGRKRLADANAVLPADASIFDLADHMNHAAALITEPRERILLAEVNLAAGKRARGAAASEVASHYLRSVIDALGEAGWQAHHALLYSAHLGLAECGYLSGDVDQALSLLRVAEAHTSDLLSRVRLRNLRTSLLSNKSDFRGACENAVGTIALLGVELPPLDDAGKYRDAVRAEFAAYQQARAGRDVASLGDLPPMQDPLQLALIETYAKTIPAAFQALRDLMVLLVLKAARAPLSHGSAPETPFFYAQYGLVHSIVTGDFETAYRFGELGVELSRRMGDASRAVGVHFIFAGFLSHWRRPISESLEHFRLALQAGQDGGDILHLGYSAGFLPAFRWYAGDRVDALAAELPVFLDMVDRTDDVTNRSALVMLRSALQALRGQTAAPGSLDGEGFSEAEFERSAPHSSLAFYGAVKALVGFVFGQRAEVVALTERLPRMPNIFYHGDYKLFHALGLVSQARAAAPEERAQLLERARQDLATLAQWKELCPANHSHRHALVTAELAALGGDLREAMSAYDTAIAAARAGGFDHHQALANELCAEFHLAEGRVKVARPYLSEALYLYGRWGASAKVAQLESAHAAVFGASLATAGQRAAGPGGPEAAALGKSSELAGALDLATAMRATEVITSELVLERALEHVMRSLIESAGAQRGVLISERQGTLRLRASLSIDPDEIRLDLDEEIGRNSALPSGLIRLVARSKTPVVVADARRDPRVSAEAYIRSSGCKSALGVPLIHRGQLIGVVYLENNATTDAFSPERVGVLQFLAAQAASALENARLYGDLDRARSKLELANAGLEAEVSKRTEELRRALSELWSEMDLATKIQTVLLPSDRRSGDYDIAASMRPADQVGGDYYDIVEVGDRTWVLIGDVSGHGVNAGLSMMMVQTAVRAILSAAAARGWHVSPSELLSQTNAAVSANLKVISADQYMTITALELHGSRVRHAGLHLDILVHRARLGTVERTKTHGIWLGVLDDITELLEDATIELEPGDTMLLFTDGITELRVDGEMIGTDGLKARLSAARPGSSDPAAVVAAIMGALNEHKAEDDMTVMAVRYAPQLARIAGQSAGPSSKDGKHGN